MLLDEQNSANTAALLQACSQQLSQNITNNTPVQQSQQLQQQLLSNQAIYQHLRNLNAVTNPFNCIKLHIYINNYLADLSPYPILMTPSPFPSSLFLPNLDNAMTPNNPLNGQANQMGFDFMNNSLLSSTSPLFQACSGLFNQYDLGAAQGSAAPATALQNQIGTKTPVAGLNNNIFNTPQVSYLYQRTCTNKMLESSKRNEPVT